MSVNLCTSFLLTSKSKFDKPPQKWTLPTGIVSQRERVSIDIATIKYDEGPNIALDKL